MTSSDVDPGTIMLLAGLLLLVIVFIGLRLQAFYDVATAGYEESVPMELTSAAYAHCPKCGYDLRESRDVCPECGAHNVAYVSIEPSVLRDRLAASTTAMTERIGRRSRRGTNRRRAEVAAGGGGPAAGEGFRPSSGIL